MIIIGILANELFDPQRKNKFEVFWMLSITLLWTLFLGITDYGLFGGGLSAFLALIATLLLVFAFGLFTLFIIKKFKLVNKILALPTAIMALAMLTVVLIDKYDFFPPVMLPMIIASLIVTIMGTFVFIDFLIKTSEGYKNE
jgi:O-antigen/teichoic acid export membrane protein